MNKVPEYIVVPFRPTLKKNSKYAEIAIQVHEIITNYVSQGWEYVGIEKIEATIELGLSVEEPTGIQVMIFKR